MRSIAYAEGVSLDWKCGALAEGLDCYRGSEFFLAHEHWESVWLRVKDPEKSFLQALIQTAAAFHHFQAGNFIGAASLLRRVLLRIESNPVSASGIALEPLRMGVREWLRALESGTSSFPASFPRIHPIDSSPGAAPET